MKIYIDSEYKCHVSPGEGLRAVETDAFEGKREAYIEGYRFVPAGDTWVRADGEAFPGEMIAPWLDWQTLDRDQALYERSQYTALTKQNEELVQTLAQMVEEVYESDLNEMGGAI